MLRPLLFFVAVASVQAQTTQVNSSITICEVKALVDGTFHQGPLPLHVYIEGCEIPPCRLPQRQDVVVNIIFRAPRVLRTMRTRARAFLPMLPLGLNYNLQENEHTCNFLQNTYCPVMEGEIVRYTLKMYIEEFFPVGTDANVEFRVEDENNSIIFCLRSAISILPPVEGLLA